MPNKFRIIICFPITKFHEFLALNDCSIFKHLKSIPHFDLKLTNNRNNENKNVHAFVRALTHGFTCENTKF